MEIQDSGLACKALAERIYADGGARGVPKYRLFNRYNREFWIADRSQEVRLHVHTRTRTRTRAHTRTRTRTRTRTA